MRKNGHARPAESDFKSTKRRLQQDRWKAKINGVTNAEIPDRDELDYFGNTFAGLSRMKLEFRGLTDQEQATNSTDSRVLASHASIDGQRAVTRNAVQDKIINVAKLDDNLNGLNGKIPDGEINMNKTTGNLAAGRVSGLGFNHIGGKMSAKRLSGRIPKANMGKVSWSSIDGKPAIPTQNDLGNLNRNMRRWASRTFKKA